MLGLDCVLIDAVPIEPSNAVDTLMLKRSRVVAPLNVTLADGDFVLASISEFSEGVFRFPL